MLDHDEKGKNILGCFVAGPANYADEDPLIREGRQRKGELFSTYIWGEFGISGPLKTLKRSNYGKDLRIVLLQFYALPLLEELANLKEIERYRPKEGAIGIPIVIHDENFFNRPDLERRLFLKNAILEKTGLTRRSSKEEQTRHQYRIIESGR